MVIKSLVSYLFASVVFLAILAIVASFLLWRRAGKDRVAGLAFWVGVVVLITSIGWLVLSTGVYTFVGSNTCIWCHEMAPEYNTWRASSHGRVQCLACHLRPIGAATLVYHEYRALREVWLHFTGTYPRIINKDSSLSQKHMVSASCDRCHRLNGRRQTEITTHIKIDHGDHLEVGMRCQQCHNRITHKGARGYPYLDGMEMMAGCFRCHKPGDEKTVGGKKAPSGCQICHREPNWAVTVFGKRDTDEADLDECRACHRVRDDKLVRDYNSSKMAKEAVDCSDCHNQHFRKFIPEPSAKDCTVCHPKAPREVITGRMAFKGYKPPFSKESEVRCRLCHPNHTFKPIRPTSK